MIVDDAHGNPITAASRDAVALLDATVSAYLGFRQDTGDRLKAVFGADPDLAMAHCLRGCFMMLFGQRAMVPRARRSLDAARRRRRRPASRRARRRISRRAGHGSPEISPASRCAGRRS